MIIRFHIAVALRCGGLTRGKTLQRMGIYADFTPLQSLCSPCQSWRLRQSLAIYSVEVNLLVVVEAGGVNEATD